VRAFIALRLDPAVEEAIAGLIERLRAPESGIASDGVRWVRRANFHLTLFFLGPAVPRERLVPIADELGVIARTTVPFEVATRGVGAFPNPARPRVIWVGLDSVNRNSTGSDGGGLATLALRVAEAAVRCGFAPERWAWSPHLTIGRVRSPKSLGRLRRALGEAANSSFGVSRIERVMLYRSEPGPQSSTYHELATFPFDANGRG
jgi:RNA 2',3'-cyclic 3'-phosphodiesterase